MTDSVIQQAAKNPLYSVTGPIGTGMIGLALWLGSQFGQMDDAITQLATTQQSLSERVATLSGKVEGVDQNRDQRIRADFESFKADALQKLETCEERITQLEQTRGRRR